jgi:O-acetyl-ADP-ribose deacetylase (regulator of RNase III)
MFEEIEGDLFSAPKSWHLAHCVSSDFHMGAGIAVGFKKKYGSVEKLRSQKVGIGRCAYLNKERYVFYLVTKARYFQKPTYQTLESALRHLRELCRRKWLTKLAMPRIGCGIDGLQWSKVKRLIRKVFDNTKISVRIYTLPSQSITYRGQKSFGEKD